MKITAGNVALPIQALGQIQELFVFQKIRSLPYSLKMYIKKSTSKSAKKIKNPGLLITKYHFLMRRDYMPVK